MRQTVNVHKQNSSNVPDALLTDSLCVVLCVHPRQLHTFVVSSGSSCVRGWSSGDVCVRGDVTGTLLHRHHRKTVRPQMQRSCSSKAGRTSLLGTYVDLGMNLHFKISHFRDTNIVNTNREYKCLAINVLGLYHRAGSEVKIYEDYSMLPVAETCK